MIFPDRTNESYRYTSFSKWNGLELVAAPPCAKQALPEGLAPFEEPTAPRLVFINGGLSRELSTDLKPSGFALESLPGNAVVLDDPFVRFNAAQNPEYPVLITPENHAVEKTLKLFFFTTAEQTAPETKTLSSPRLGLRVKAGAALRVEEIHVTEAGAAGLENGVLEIHVEAGGSLVHHGVFRGHADSTRVHSIAATLGTGATFTSHSFSLGSGIERHNLVVRMEGENASCRLYGLSAIGTNLHVDHHTLIEHAVPHTTSDQVYKGIVAEGGKAAFNGKVVIAKNACKSNAAQLNRNLLLGPKAEANAKPELEIANDDVKCSHGATIGQLSDEEVFYLQSRGIPRDQALAMLVRGFADDVLSRVESAFLRQALNGILTKDFFKGGM